MRGKTLGRPKKSSPKQIAEARHILETDYYSSIAEIAESFRVHEVMLKRALALEISSS